MTSVPHPVKSRSSIAGLIGRNGFSYVRPESFPNPNLVRYNNTFRDFSFTLIPLLRVMLALTGEWSCVLIA